MPAFSRLPRVRQLQRQLAAKDEELEEKRRELRQIRSILIKESAKPRVKAVSGSVGTKVHEERVGKRSNAEACFDTVTGIDGKNAGVVKQPKSLSVPEHNKDAANDNLPEMIQHHEEARDMGSEAEQISKEIIDTLIDMVTASVEEKEKEKGSMPTPKRDAVKMLEALKVTPTVSRIRTLLPVTVTIDTVRKAPTALKKNLFDENKTGVKRVQSSVAAVVNLSRKSLRIKRKKRMNKDVRGRKRKEDRQKVLTFLCRADNSFELPSKRDNVRGQGRHSLKDTLKNLHGKFLKEIKPEVISLTSFCNARPPYIKVIRHTNRKQCLCHRCANICLKAEAAKTLPKSPQSIAAMTDDAILQKLETLPTSMKYMQWIKKPVQWKTKESKKMKLCDVSTTARTFRSNLMLEIEGFRQHVQTATTQYEQVRELKSNLEPLKEVTCQMDYSENWAGKYPEEITSVYFDNDQISLHPMVLHYKDEQGELQTKSYVGISPDTTHTMPCTYAFIAGLLGRVLDTLPNLNTIHFITDSPSSQYRNRNVIELVRRFPNLFGGMIATWNWLESGHGKGPCDGVGGSIKKKADNLVKSGKVMRTAKEFTKVLNAAGVKSVLFLVPQHEMFDRKEEVKLWRSPPANGVMAMHTITMRDGRMFMRKTSCFKSCCWSHGKPVLNCEGWRTCYGPKVQSSIVQREMTEESVDNVPVEDDMALADLREKTQEVVPVEDDMPLAKRRKKKKEVVPGEDDMPLAKRRKKTQEVVPGEDDMPLADLREKTQEVVPGEDDMPLADLREKTQEVVPGEDDMPLADLHTYIHIYMYIRRKASLQSGIHILSYICIYV